jgi:hypothetical protein
MRCVLLERVIVVDSQNQPEPTEPDPFTGNSEGSIKRCHVRWLEWVCAARWRTLVAWIALSVAAAAIFSSRLGTGLYHGLLHVADELPRRLPLPIHVIDLPEVWWVSLIMFAFMWFQPLLLRLDSSRTCAWIAAFTVSPVIGAMVHYQKLAGFIALFPYIVGTTAALTSTLLLIGQRTRPWLGFLAGLAVMLGLLAASAYVFALRGGPESWAGVTSSNVGLPGLYPMVVVSAVRPSLLVIMFGNVLFGLPLIFGTKPITRHVVHA